MSNKNTVLIVDDDDINRSILEDVFGDLYECIQADNGIDALKIIREKGKSISAILLDVVMPNMSGIDVIKEIRKIEPKVNTPIILITGDESVPTVEISYDLGVSDIIYKPFIRHIVRRRIKNVIDLYNHQSNLENMVEEQTHKIEEQAKALQSNNDFIIDTLSTVLEFRSMESGEHIKRIKGFTHILLEEYRDRYADENLSDEVINKIASASAMHDIGKVAIPDSVLLKPGRLTDEEFSLMKEHTTKGCEILETVYNNMLDKDFYNYCYEICRHHHERYDGKGYPDGLKGDDIPLSAQIVSIADVYDALVSKRVYKAAYSYDKAAQMILNGECGIFSQNLLECFMNRTEEFKEFFESCI